MDQSPDTHSEQRSPGSRITRRGFLATLAVGSAAAALPNLAHAQDATPEAAATPVTGGALIATDLPTTWDQEADVVVVGTGAAAYAAAVTAVQAGLSAIMLEKAEGFGGTTIYSGNAYWIPNNPMMVAAGYEDPREDALKYMVRLAYPALYDPESPTLGVSQYHYDMIGTFYDQGSQAITAFEEWGALYSVVSGSNGYSEKPDFADPDYSADLPENKAPYGRTLHPDPDRGNGATTVPDQMKAWTDAQDVPLLLSHRVIGLYLNGNKEVVGVQVETPDGEVAIRANKGVVFGTGGFTQDPVKDLAFLRGPIFAGCGAPTNTGDFLNIGIAAGAQLGNMSQAWWLQCPLEMAVTTPVLPGADIWMIYGDSMIVVNKYGKRIMTEKITYNERGQTHFTWDPGKREYPNLVEFIIYDQAVAESTTEWAFRWPVPMPGDEADYVIQGNTIQELADNINARLDTLRGQGHLSAKIGPNVVLGDDFATVLADTIDRFNGFAERGVDEDFGRGSTPIQVAWHGPAREGNTANPTMYPINTDGPLYCILIGAMTLDTKGGPVTDAGGRVLSVAGTPIPGLYGAGNCVASPAGQGYWSAGGTIGPALTFGYLAGQNVAAERDKAIA